MISRGSFGPWTRLGPLQGQKSRVDLDRHRMGILCGSTSSSRLLLTTVFVAVFFHSGADLLFQCGATPRFRQGEEIRNLRRLKLRCGGTRISS